MANWAEVPQELLELIAQRLTIEDFLAFGMVCTSWRSAAIKETYNAKSKVPLLLTYVLNRRRAYLDPSGRRIYRVKPRRIQVQTLPTPGWTLVSNRRRQYRIFNPLSRISIELPSFDKLRHMSPLGGWEPEEWKWDATMSRIALSSSPSLSRSYIVMISLTRDLGIQGFAFHRSGEDAWTVVSPASRGKPCYVVRGMIFYDGLFVALDSEGHIMTLNEREGRMESRLVQQDFGGCPYLVECLGSLLVVWKMSSFADRFQVFEVDLEKGTQEEIRCLGSASLFLNEGTCSSFSVVFNAESRLGGIKPNHIYFTDNYRKKKSYSMDNGKVWTSDDATSHSAAWFQPGF